MSNVKGALMIWMIKAIRANKTGIYDDKFNAEDWQVLKGIIYHSGWYPFELYKKMLKVTAEVEIDSSGEKLFEWGYEGADLLIGRLYNSFIIENSVIDTIQNYIRLHKMFFDSCSIEMQRMEDKKVQLGFLGIPSDFEEFFHLVRGWNCRIIERAGAKNIESRFVSKSWESDPVTTIEYTWD